MKNKTFEDYQREEIKTFSEAFEIANRFVHDKGIDNYCTNPRSDNYFVFNEGHGGICSGFEYKSRTYWDNYGPRLFELRSTIADYFKSTRNLVSWKSFSAVWSVVPAPDEIIRFRIPELRRDDDCLWIPSINLRIEIPAIGEEHDVRLYTEDKYILEEMVFEGRLHKQTHEPVLEALEEWHAAVVEPLGERIFKS